MFKSGLFLSSVLLMSAMVTPVLATSISWSTSLDSQSGTFFNRTYGSSAATQPINLLGEPDINAERVVFESTNSASFSKFDEIVSYDTLDFINKTGIGSSVLAAGDFILFDQNYQKVAGVERSTYIFSDGSNSYTYHHGGISAPSNGALLHNSYMSRDNFRDLFSSSDDNYNQWVGLLVLDLDAFGINAASAQFSVTISGASTSCGYDCPDVIGFGLLNTTAMATPVPAAIWFLGSALLGFLGFRRIHESA